MRVSRGRMLLCMVLLASTMGSAQVKSKSRTTPQTKSVDRADEQTEQQFADSVNVALVVGVSDYPESSGLSPLQYAANDADSMAYELRKRGYLVDTLTNANAMHQAVYSKITQLSHHLNKDQGTFVFFFSGHGFSLNDKAYLATFDTNRADLSQGALAVKEVAEALKNSGAKRQMMFLDACRDNAVLVQKGKAVPPPLPPLLAENDGLAVLWSTKAESYSYEDPASKHGIYTNYLVKALDGGAAKSGAITFRGVSDFVTKNVYDDARQKQLFQRPYVAGEASGDFLVATTSVDLKITPPPPPPANSNATTEIAGNSGGNAPVHVAKGGFRPVWRGSDGRIYDVTVDPGKVVQIFQNKVLIASADKVDKKTGKLSGIATQAITRCPDLTRDFVLKKVKLDNFRVESTSDTKVELQVAKGFNTGKGYACSGPLLPDFTNFTLLLENVPQ